MSELARRLDTSEAALARALPAYNSLAIPKRRGGTRQLNIPSPALKNLQRTINHRLLKRLQAHPAATGFERGRSIVDNATPHVGKRVIIKLDVKDFFPSTTSERVDFYFRLVGWDAEAAELLTRLTTHHGGLPQGAPTSPRLSNLVNYDLDARIHRFVVRKRKGVYTRYADDITISFPKDYPKRVRGTIQLVRHLARAHGYTIHTRQKLRVLRRHQQQRVTGLVVNDRVNLPRSKRRQLRAIAHHLDHGRPATMSRESLNGWKALQSMIERQREPLGKDKT